MLRQVAGQDATQAFYNLHRNEVLQQYSALCVGTIEGETPEVIELQPGDLSQVPYAEPLWLRPQFRNVYYNESACTMGTTLFFDSTRMPPLHGLF